jgi:hypothetical protein
VRNILICFSPNSRPTAAQGLKTALGHNASFIPCFREIALIFILFVTQLWKTLNDSFRQQSMAPQKAVSRNEVL